MNLYFTCAGIKLPRVLFVLAASFIAAVLTITMLPADALAVDAPKGEAPADSKLPKGSDTDGDGDVDRPDGVSAALTAAALDKKVEDLSKRTGSTRTFVNPDGTLTDEQFGGAVRVQDVDGTWEDVDYDLVEQADGSFAPKVSPVDVEIGGGGAKQAAKLTFDDGESLAVTWPENLPKPVIDGGVATYEVSESTDLIVAVTGSGVSSRIRLNERPAEDDPVFRLGLRAEGVEVSESGRGLKLVDDKGKSVGQTSSLVAWDAKTDDAGSPAEIVPLDTTLNEVSSSGDVIKHELELAAPEGYLSDPSTEYPVIIDPDISTLSRLRDTWVRSGETTNRSAGYYLVSGKINGSANTNPAYTYLKFHSGAIEGKDVIAAELRLWQYYAYTCSDRRMNAYPVADYWSPSVTYATRPGVVSGYSTYVDTNRGTTGCGDGWTRLNVSNMVKAWGDGTFVNEGIRLTAADGGFSSYERRFCSMDPESGTTCNSSTKMPFLSVTYNGPPKTAAAPTAAVSRSWDGLLIIASTKPTWSTSATDAEASKVKYTTEARPTTSSSTVSSTCTTALVASGATASCTPTTALVNGSTYWARSKATDSLGAVGPWSPWRQFTIDTTVPSVPAVACTGVANGQWYETGAPADTTCTFSAAAGVDIDWKINNAAKAPLSLSSGSATSPAIAIATTGYTRVEGRARTRAGAVSEWKSFAFGTGEAVITEPIKDDRSTSTFPINAAAPAGADSGKIQWRFAPTTEGDTTTGWADATEVKKASDGAAWSGSVSGTDMSSTPRLLWDPQAETGIGAQGLVEVRVVFTYPGDVTKASPLQRVQVIPHAFGGSFPTEDFGPGQAALFTGEFQLSQSDVDVPGYGESLILGRSHLSMAGEPAGAAGVFGPGWKADLSGPAEGAAGFTVVDRTGTDGTIQLTDPEGESYVYLHSSKTKGAQKAGAYNGVGETALNEDSLTLTTVTGETGITHRLTLTEWDDTRTIFVRTTSGVWTTEKVISPEAHGTTTYAHDTDGSVTWIFAPAPSGVNCDTSAQDPGCRALNLIYTGTGTSKRLSEVRLRIWDPEPGTDGTPGPSAGMDTISVAKYSYDGDGRLAAVWDPRVADGVSALKTEYEYATVGGRVKLTKVTEPGLKPWRLEYTDGGKINRVLRAQDAASGSGDATWTVKYDLALAGSGDGLPNMSSDATQAWSQLAVDAPTGGTAVFGPDQVPDPTPTASQYEYADLSYFNESGRTTNSASYGAGAWQIDSTRYDALGNSVWSLGAEGRRMALAEGTTVTETAGAADKYATVTVYNTAGTRVEETYDPMREMTLDNGDLFFGRTVTQTVYDDEADTGLVPGRPTTGVPDDGFGLAVEERSSVTDRTGPGAEGALFDTTKTRYRYDPVSSGDGDGWELKTPTRTMVEDGAGWATTLTRFDQEGKVVETRTPQGTETTDGAGSDTRSTKTVYYTADTSASRAECRSKPAWAGEVCWTGPAGQPGTGQPIPATTTTGYSVLLAPTRVETTSGPAARVDISGFDASGRPTTSSTATSGLATADRAVAATTTTYNPTTGAIASVSNGAVTQTTSYDSWGRAVSQTDGTGNTATTSYDAAGRVATADDGKGAYAYTYNGNDSRGQKERRGLVTSLDVGLASGPDVFTGAYDAAGELVEQNYPGGIRATWDRDITGAETALTYQSGGEVLLAYSASVDANSRVRTMTGASSAQAYTYDDRDRLATVQDTWQNDCSTRVYGFSGDSDRTSLTTYGPTSGGDCQNSTGGATVTSAFDAADRITTTGYAYDELGRTKTAPAAHTSNDGGGALSVGYHANDMVATLSQNVVENGATITKAQDFTLDTSDRLSVTKNLTAGVSVVESTNHYDSTDDSPAWTETKTRPDAATAWATAWNRNVAGLSGDMAVIAGSDGTAKLQLGNLHGDIAATVDIGGTGIDTYTEYTEYGLPRDPVNTPERYGWLGAKQRDANTVGGLTLMGARLYNPTTGRFLSRDPVAGGNDNTYTYPTDPINKFDLDGQWWRVPRPIRRWGNRVAAHALGAGYAYANRRAGARCYSARGMNVCHGARARLWARGGTTIGTTYATSNRRSYRSAARLRHERVHVRQWKHYGLGFIPRYIHAGSNPCKNRYERQAGLKRGGYRC